MIWASRFASFARSRRAIRSITFGLRRFAPCPSVVPLLSLSQLFCRKNTTL